MAKKPVDKPETDDEESGPFVPPPMPAIPSKDGRSHRATYAKKRDEMKNVVPGYNIRVVGPAAAKMSRRWVPVTKLGGAEAMEFLMTRLWHGIDEDTGEPIGLYEMYKKPRELEDEIPF